MPARIRLQRHGKKAKPFYHIVVSDARAPRDGKFIEKLGTYNPLSHPPLVEVDIENAVFWLQKGAQPTDTVRSILSHTGVLYKKHLLEGVSKGAFDQNEAEKRFQLWLEEKASKMQGKKEALIQRAKEEKVKKNQAEAQMREARAQKNKPEKEEVIAQELNEAESSEIVIATQADEEKIAQ
ncbi:30S ribosomal protein S16 [Bacteroidetes bacterium endosymbiont of Geopemphigus sp.]|uniref:30S ribosomal protein S16 n=1 Tax=Bacteroidetes bacterium endosymbiont of Geopemphigus sp. TaxID=2047937 RepID=UPI000CCFFE40|nr:30S ribosomal protein S16 [Bacteroidetes bacterium endosymbiont of Geopemphigus sp.]